MFHYPQGMTRDPSDALRELARNLNADAAVARGAAHDAFDPIWQSGKMSRTAAYKWLAERMGLNADDCHMEKFDAQQCHKVIEICRD